MLLCESHRPVSRGSWTLAGGAVVHSSAALNIPGLSYEAGDGTIGSGDGWGAFGATGLQDASGLGWVGPQMGVALLVSGTYQFHTVNPNTGAYTNSGTTFAWGGTSWTLANTDGDAFSSLVPEIAVEQPSGTDIADGGSKDFGTVATGGDRSLTFTIRNTGSMNLTGLGTNIDGTDALRFTVTATPVAPVTAGGSTVCTVNFAPTTTGPKMAVLHITNNDVDETPFDITLTGTATAAQLLYEAWAANEAQRRCCCLGGCHSLPRRGEELVEIRLQHERPRTEL